MTRWTIVLGGILLSGCAAPEGDEAAAEAMEPSTTTTTGSEPYRWDHSTWHDGDKGDAKDRGSSIFGDGSAGARGVDASGELDLGENLQFTDFTINSGITVFVRSGAVLRCTGTFKNYGTINVLPAAAVGSIALGGTFPDFFLAGSTPADPGVSLGIASNPHVNTTSPGPGGIGLTDFQARQVLHPGIKAGGGGGGAFVLGDISGGGSLTVLCKGKVHNWGTITANGGVAHGITQGGGAGGVIILASKTKVVSPGELRAVGGDGADAADFGTEFDGGGGGGGGGIVHLMSPSMTVNTAGVLVDGGEGGGGTANPVAAGQLRLTGAGGGACGGSGGAGASVQVGAPIPAAQSGRAGYLLRTLADPSDLF